MPRRKKREHDFSITAFRVGQEATEQHEPESQPQAMESENPHAVALGRLGGRKGGPARAKKLTGEQRKEIAQKAARGRWAKV